MGLFNRNDDNDHIVNIDTLISKYLRYIKQKGYTDATISAYRKELNYLFRLIDEKILSERKKDEDYAVGDILITDIDDLISYLIEEKDNADSTIARKLCCLSSFFSYLKSRNLLKNKDGEDVDNIMESIEYPSIEKKVPFVPSISIYEKFQNVLENRSYRNEFEKICYKLFFYMKFSSMARTIEMVRIRVKDLDFKNRTLLIKGKGKKERIVPVTKKALMYAWHFIRVADLDKDDLLIRNRYNKPITKRALDLRMQTLREEAGLSDKITLHKLFRKTPATELKRRGDNITLTELQDILGHQDPETTRIYVDSQVRKVIEDFRDSSHPFDNL